MNLRNKNAIVTGANRGIGLAVVEELARNGANVWACYRTSSSETEATMQAIAEKYNVAIEPVCFDVTNADAVKSAIKQIGLEKKPIDILVNNAGVTMNGLFSMTSMEQLQEAMNVNFISMMRITQLVVRYMQKKKSGSIVNIASVSGMENEQGRLAYGASKAAVIFATKTLSLELGENGIRVNAVSPGFIDTDMWKSRSDALRQQILEETPLHRQGTTQEVAQLICYLSSEDASYITGQNIVADGGRLR